MFFPRTAPGMQARKIKNNLLERYNFLTFIHVVIVRMQDVTKTSVWYISICYRLADILLADLNETKTDEIRSIV